MHHLTVSREGEDKNEDKGVEAGPGGVGGGCVGHRGEEVVGPTTTSTGGRLT